MRLYISNEAIKKYGYEHFYNFSYNMFANTADQDLKELDDGLLIVKKSVSNNLDKDIFMQALESDSNFIDIEDIRLKINTVYYSQFFNMKKICEEADVNYQTFRNWKNSNSPIAKTKILNILNAMIKTATTIKSDLNSLNSI